MIIMEVKRRFLALIFNNKNEYREVSIILQGRDLQEFVHGTMSGCNFRYFENIIRKIV